MSNYVYTARTAQTLYAADNDDDDDVQATEAAARSCCYSNIHKQAEGSWTYQSAE